METYLGKVCPFCKTEIKEGDAIKICPACGIPHHEACWEKNKGCTTFGCSEQHHEAQGTNQTVVCPNCGTSLGHDQDFCPKCGTSKGGVKKNFCGTCGAELQDGQAFCPKCGQKADPGVAANVSSASSQRNADVNKMNSQKKNKLVIMIAAISIVAIAAIVLVALTVSGGKVDFEKIYDEYCFSTWATVGSDGSYLTIDTNPYDLDDNGLAVPAAYRAIKEVNNALGLPESLINEMGETTGADGKQSETFEDLGITVIWKYHPDKGLEVTYKRAT